MKNVLFTNVDQVVNVHHENETATEEPIDEPPTDAPSTKQSFMFIHTTDIHGWVAGHAHEAIYNADFGDFASLMEHLLEKNDKYVLLFDSGDVIEGTGLSDFPQIHGEKIFPIVQKIPGFGALTIGNHGIYTFLIIHKCIPKKIITKKN